LKYFTILEACQKYQFAEKHDAVKVLELVE